MCKNVPIQVSMFAQIATNVTAKESYSAAFNLSQQHKNFYPEIG